MTSRSRPEILLIGGGYVGMYTALRLSRRLKRDEASLTVVDPESYMTYQPFLPEAAAGNLEPRHVVVSLRRVLPRVRIVNGRVTRVDHAGRTATVQPAGGAPRTLSYDILVYAPGSIARTLPIPGLADVGIGFRTVGEAMYLRNHVLGRLDVAESTEDPALRARALTFLVIGGGYAGIEALAELEDMARAALRYYRGVTAAEMRWVLVEASGRTLPEVSEGLGRYTEGVLRQRRIDVRLRTRVTSLTGGQVELDDGTSFSTDTVIWTAGVRPNPLIRSTDLPCDDRDRVRTTAFLTVEGTADAWSAGDCAAVPDLTRAPGALCSPSAQHAVRQAHRLADNLVASLRGEPLRTYRHAHLGSVASLGLHRGVAELKGVRLRGYPAWFLHRTYHVSRVPTVNRKVRVVADWTLGLFFSRDVVSLSGVENPRGHFRRAAMPEPAGDDGEPSAEYRRSHN